MRISGKRLASAAVAFSMSSGTRLTGTETSCFTDTPSSFCASVTSSRSFQKALRCDSLAASASCGVDATGVLDVTSAEGGTQAVPVTIPTGRPGPPTTHERTQTVAIPDDNAGGVVSTLIVPVSGRIKDLNVRLNVAHTFVGDLKVELTSPDNSTTVRLVEHAGGPAAHPFAPPTAPMTSVSRDFWRRGVARLARVLRSPLTQPRHGGLRCRCTHSIR